MESPTLARHEFSTSELVLSFPPRLTHPNKKLVYQLACPSGAEHRGKIVFSRWREMSLPTVLEAGDFGLEGRESVFAYEPEPAGVVAWYVNFADPDLFCAYGGRLLAQDELQVAEHPTLGSLREALLATGTKPRTEENLRPTPVLVTGVERRCALATGEIYGNRFAQASADVVRRATRVLTPPTITNLIAIAAPGGGLGVYRKSEIERILVTAFTGFAAARVESARLAATPAVAIHTGFWGCGAFGGNRVLMALLQILAARLAGIDRLVFYTFDRTGSASLEEARSTLEPIARPGAAVPDVVAAIDALELAWGVSDGT